MLDRLLVRDFRCFAEAELTLHPDTTLLVGNNAQGKTSLLEALCVVLRLQSPRTSTRTDLIRFGSRNCLVEVNHAEHRLRFAQSATTRRLAVDNSICGRSADYLQSSCRVVWMDHSDMLLVRGGAENRRRYLDFTAAQLFPGYLQALRHYERVLRSRNYLLKKDSVIHWRQADAYAVALAEHGGFIADCRNRLVQSLQSPVAAAHHHLSHGSEMAAISYDPGYDRQTGLVEQLQALRSDEERTRSTAAGIHRDEVRLLVNDQPAAAFASEGQQRSLSLALKLGQITVLQNVSGKPPLLLLDDVFGELDKRRRRALLEALPAGAQKVISTTFVDWMADLSHPVHEGLQGVQHTIESATISAPRPLGSAV